MRVTENNQKILNAEISEMTLQSLLTTDFSAQKIAYHELSENPLHEINQLSALTANVEILSVMLAKLQFMNREIRYLMRS